MRRTTSILLLAVTTALVAAATGCSGGDDVVRADSPERADAPAPEAATQLAAFRAAVGATTASTGRFTIRMSDGSVPGDEPAAEGSFDADRMVVTVGAGPGGNLRLLTIGDASYMSADGVVAAMLAMASGGDTPADAHAEWIRIAPMPDELAGAGFGDVLAAALGGASIRSMVGLGESLAGVTDVRSDGTEDVDGTAYERYRATLPASALADVVGNPVPSIPAGTKLGDVARTAATYLEDHTTVDVTLLASDGVARRITLESHVNIEERYADCPLLTSPAPPTVTIDLTDVGEPVDIPTPDPATVVDLWSRISAGDLPSADGVAEVGPRVDDAIGHLPDELLASCPT